MGERRGTDGLRDRNEIQMGRETRVKEERYRWVERLVNEERYRWVETHR